MYLLRGEISFSSVLQKRLKVSKPSFKITLFLSPEMIWLECNKTHQSMLGASKLHLPIYLEFTPRKKLSRYSFSLNIYFERRKNTVL